MIEKNHPHLSVRAQCRLLSISRSSFYRKAQGETATNLALMPERYGHLFPSPDHQKAMAQVEAKLLA